LIKFKKKTFG